MGVQNGEITSPTQAPQPPTRRLVRDSTNNNALPKAAAQWAILGQYGASHNAQYTATIFVTFIIRNIVDYPPIMR